jgi:dienelactone hydrolase
MSWLESRIRQYEQARWSVDDNRRVFPFAWGLEYLGAPANTSQGREAAADPRAFLAKWVPETIAHSDAWFAVAPATDYRLEPNVQNGSRASSLLTFTSGVESPWPNNNRVLAQFFRARNSGPAVVLLPNWNAKWHGQQSLCLWLTKLGISVLRMSMPYHDSRRAPDHERADQLVGANIGLTLQANRQAVLDTRRCLAWLHQRGYERLGIVGTSIGSSIGAITLAHEPLAQCGAFLHVSTYFGDVVREGMTTAHVWEAVRDHVTPAELREFWSPISPVPYLPKLAARGVPFFAVSGKYDPTFLPEFTQLMYSELRRTGVRHEKLDLHCGHYSLELPPFSYIAGFRLGVFLRHQLS